MPDYYRLAQDAVAALQAATQPTWTDVAGVVVAGLVGAGQCGLIWYGLRRMEATGQRRDQQLDQQEKNADRRHQEFMKDADRREQEADRRHQETMLSLRALIERTAGQENRP